MRFAILVIGVLNSSFCTWYVHTTVALSKYQLGYLHHFLLIVDAIHRKKKGIFLYCNYSFADVQQYTVICHSACKQ